MSPRWIFNNNFYKLTGSILLSLSLALITTSVGMAVLVSINTNNNSYVDWNPVPIFMSDVSGDQSTSCSGASGRDDIVQVYVATGPVGSAPDYIYFRMVATAASAFSDQYHWVAAYLDCDVDGVQDPKDAQVIYMSPAAGDIVVLGDGYYPNPHYVRRYDQTPEEFYLGERPADALNSVEFSVPIADMVNFPVENGGPLYCSPTTPARIKFYSIKVKPITYYWDCTFDETEWRDFNIPTSIELTSFKAKENRAWVNISSLTFGLAVLFGIAGLSIYLRKKS